MQIDSKYVGIISYEKGIELMEEKINEAVQQKKCYVYGMENHLVYTAGIKTNVDHILENIPVVKSRRGGSITLHNPGQLVFYAILPIKSIQGGMVEYIRMLENVIINTLKQYGVRAFLHPDHTGVWTNSGKIAFVGLALKNKCIYHGCAINVENDLEDYAPIKSCGLDLPITRLIDELNSPAKDSLSLPDFYTKMEEQYSKSLQKIILGNYFKKLAH